MALWWMTAAVAYFRLFVGVNFTDEAFYSSLPYSFALGLKPYHEELNITQNAGILLTPLYWLYVQLVGSPIGLILFNRHLYLRCSCSAAGWPGGWERPGSTPALGGCSRHSC